MVEGAQVPSRSPRARQRASAHAPKCIRWSCDRTVANSQSSTDPVVAGGTPTSKLQVLRGICPRASQDSHWRQMPLSMRSMETTA
nr:hypothetical protein CFP56_78335 [Quercus suber]